MTTYSQTIADAVDQSDAAGEYDWEPWQRVRHDTEETMRDFMKGAIEKHAAGFTGTYGDFRTGCVNLARARYLNRPEASYWSCYNEARKYCQARGVKLPDKVKTAKSFEF